MEKQERINYVVFFEQKGWQGCEWFVTVEESKEFADKIKDEYEIIEIYRMMFEIGENFMLELVE